MSFARRCWRLAMTTELAIAGQPLHATPRTPSRKTLGHAAAKVAKLLGLPLLPWQRLVLDVALEVDENGRLVYPDVTLSVMRQQGKTVCLLVLIVTRALLEPRSNIVYAAQSALDAKRKLDTDWTPTIEGSLLGSQVTVRRAPGREGLVFANGSRMEIAASTVKAAHGQVVDLAVVDEAFSYADSRLEQALKPAMMTRPSAQFWCVSTAGSLDRSSYLLERVQTGRQAVEAGLTEGLAFFEWGAPDEADPASPETWRRHMPALGHTVTVSAVRSAQQSMGRNEFARGYLNRWVLAQGETIIPIERWQALGEPDAPRPPWVVLGLDVAPKGASAAIVVVGERGDALQAAVVEHGPGSDWVPQALERIVAEYDHPRLLVDGKAVAQMLPELERITGFRVTEMGTADVPTACAFFLRLAQEGKLRHRGEPELTIALDGAGQRTLGDGWAWSRRSSGADITPLCALTWAASFWRGAWGTLDSE
jgi:phage terminase large subunit-like protein